MSARCCPSCGSADTEDCGEIGDGVHHYECSSCGMGFPVSAVPPPEETKE